MGGHRVERPRAEIAGHPNAVYDVTERHSRRRLLATEGLEG